MVIFVGVTAGVGVADLGESPSLLFDLGVDPRDEFCPPADKSVPHNVQWSINIKQDLIFQGIINCYKVKRRGEQNTCHEGLHAIVG